MELNTINERMCYYRKLFGYNQKEMADKLDMNYSTYTAKERRGNITCDLLLKFSAVLGIDPDLILYIEKPLIEPPVPEFELSDRELDLLTMYRNVSIKKKDIIFKFVYDVFKRK